MTGNTVGYQMRSDRLARLAIVLAMIAAIFVVAPPAQGADVFSVEFSATTSGQIEGNSGTVDKTIAVTLTTATPLLAPATADVTLLTSGSASSSTDFTFASPSTVTFPAGSVSGDTQNVTVTVKGDTTPESNETVDLALGNPSAGGAVGTNASHTLTITNDDADSFSVEFSATTSSQIEGNSGTVDKTIAVTLTTVTPLLAPATADVTLLTSGSASSSTDFTFASPSTVTFPAGSVSGDTQNVTVTVKGDTLDEVNETVDLALGNPSAGGAVGTNASHTLTINDNDLPPTVSIANGSAVEGNGTVSFNVTLSAMSGKTVTVDYATANVTAIAPADYTAKTGNVVFAPGEQLKAVSVSIINDTRDEPDAETFNVLLTLPAGSNASTGDMTGVGTINDDDPTPTLSVNSVSVEEGLTATFTVTLSAASNQTVTVNYKTANGTAAAPGDYTAIGTTELKFTPGQITKTVDIATVEDLFNEANETFTLVLSSAKFATIPVPSGTGTILNDDGPPGLSVIDATPAAEGSVGVVFTVSLLPASGQTVTVKYATANGTALAGSDYTAKTGTLTFPAGITTKTVTVPIVNDSIDEIAETLLLNLSGATNAGIVDAKGVGTIADNDNVAPDVVKARTTDAGGNPGFTFRTGETVKLRVDFTDPGLADAHGVILDWGDGTAPTAFALTPAGARSFERTHTYSGEGLFQISVTVNDGDGGSDTNQAFVTVSKGAIGDGDDTVGLVDPTRSVWRLYNDLGVMVTEFYYGNPGDYPFMGDWDGDGIDTPGLYRQSDGFVYLRNSNTQGLADIQFYFGNPGDIPIAGDFNNDGKDTVSIYRPSNQTFYIINELGANGGGLGASEVSYVFGDPGDKPFVGDFDGDGIDTVGLHRESTGLVYFRNTHTQGNADNQFIFGDPGDQLIAGDWTLDGIDTPALYRSSDQTVYWRFTNTQGNADATFDTGVSGWIPVAGVTGV